MGATSRALVSTSRDLRRPAYYSSIAFFQDDIDFSSIDAAAERKPARERRVHDCRRPFCLPGFIPAASSAQAKRDEGRLLMGPKPSSRRLMRATQDRKYDITLRCRESSLLGHGERRRPGLIKGEHNFRPASDFPVYARAINIGFR